MGEEGLASSAQHHREDGPASLLGPLSKGSEQRAVCSGGLFIQVEAAVLLKLRLSPGRVEGEIARRQGCGLKCRWRDQWEDGSAGSGTILRRRFYLVVD